ncbi:MAG TPA: ribosome silencing factor [Candidatus Limnocylindrales bacterium]
MTEPTPISETLPSPDGLPRRVKPVARTRKPTAADLAAEAAMQAAADALVAEIESQGGDSDLAEVSDAAAAATEPEPEPKLSPLEIARRIVDAAEDKKAADIVLLDVTALTSMADYFVVCSGGSERQLGAIADGVSEKLRDEGVRPIGREGGAGSHWTLLDFGSVIVHVFAPPERDYYQLERLWSKAKTIVRVQ